MSKTRCCYYIPVAKRSISDVERGLRFRDRLLLVRYKILHAYLAPGKSQVLVVVVVGGASSWSAFAGEGREIEAFDGSDHWLFAPLPRQC